MYRYFRLLAFFYVIYCVVTLAPNTGAAAGLAARAATPAASVQRSNRSGFPELERRAAAQEGLSDHDKTFLMSAVQAETLQRELSRVAISHTKNPAVRHFAEATAQFMGKMASRLGGIGSEFGMSLPRIVPDEVDQAQSALGKSKDPDREYLTRILGDTTKASNLYKDESETGKNPVVVQYAREMRPLLTQHDRNTSRLLATINRQESEARRLRGMAVIVGTFVRPR